jgi:hypothetical protein
MRIARFYEQMSGLGFSYQETEVLRRAQVTLHGWAEKECGINDGCIERDEASGKPYWLNSVSMRRYPVRDLESGALRRVSGVMAGHPELAWYHQTDPRGCSLYILRKADVGSDDLECVYTRGLAVSI